MMPQICSKLNTRVPRRLTWAEVNSSPAQAMESRGEITTILRSLALCSQLWQGQSISASTDIYRDTGFTAFLPGLLGWMFGILGWSSGPVKLVHWPLKLKSATAADFTCHIFLKNKTQRQSPLTSGYLLVQFHFAPHPPFNVHGQAEQICYLSFAVYSSWPSFLKSKT